MTNKDYEDLVEIYCAYSKIFLGIREMVFAYSNQVFDYCDGPLGKLETICDIIERHSALERETIYETLDDNSLSLAEKVRIVFEK